MASSNPSNARVGVVMDGTAGVLISKLLLGDICAATEDPDFCTAVLSTDPRTPYADLFGLASVSINLAVINATDTQKCITESYMIAYPDQTVQLQACSSDYQVIIANLKLVGNNLLDYGNSKVADKKLVEDVMHHITECENQFSSCHVIPSPLAAILIALAMRVIRRCSYIYLQLLGSLGAVKNNTVGVMVSAEMVSDICSHTADHAFCITLLNFPPSTPTSDLHTLSVNVNHFALITAVYTVADVIELIDKATPDLLEVFATCVGNWHGGILGEMYKLKVICMILII
ncbi:uncharacterized protein LOC113332810 [Papaver somniferum]|uniref:uncharacterized protein LOC113332810 n=1 Tax=Papaver somniferum TaxID=3469 RepID=UPI000E6F8095|nr:uncharacterized protein LOC113332810 [Papaver somniferum]